MERNGILCMVFRKNNKYAATSLIPMQHICEITHIEKRNISVIMFIELRK